MMLETGDIVCVPDQGYCFPEMLTPFCANDSLSKTLYEAESDDMNDFEYETIQQVAALDNVVWWHRIIDRRGFCLNGAINHFPDFVVYTRRGTIILIETKGDHLINDDTKHKLHLGRAWQHQLGAKYRYLMVFKSAELELDGALTLDKTLQVVERV